jgi:Fe-S-cluster-containing dehydrogenase component/formate-dependent nitrite reductase membrane component NrfD
MTKWAWVIDQTKCIGCHACTTACKSENDVAVGVFRTWVKNVDVGTFPAVRRHFAVLRCNHCEDAPCVEICPTTAMYQRPDGLVDFDESRCIGCKACMQACPYDAIYMDPNTQTAAKCNFCSHRVDEGLLPACVVVCPVEALLFGDMEDPTSKVSKALGAHPVTVRRPEQGTRPKAFYIGAHEAALEPLAARHEPMYMWSDGRPDAGGGSARAPQLRARVAYDVPRQRVWGGRVSAYIVTKSIGAGAGLVAVLGRVAGWGEGSPLVERLVPLIGLLFLGLTGALLVSDLKRPERFWTIMTRPQWRSWLTRGAYVITGYGALLAAWVAASLAGADRALDLLVWPLGVLALLTAAYTAFLFAQCEGRDLWQSPLLLVHLSLDAVVAGIAALALAAAATGRVDEDTLRYLTPIAAGLLVATGLLAMADAFGRHATTNAAAAAQALARGPQSALFQVALVGGMFLPAMLMAAASASSAALVFAALLALGGQWMYAHAFVLAGQGPPIS